jgi:hypothetical protein
MVNGVHASAVVVAGLRSRRSFPERRTGFATT